MPVSRTSIARFRRCRSNCSAWRCATRLRTAIEVRDFNGADRIINELDTVGACRATEPSVAVLVGRLKEALGRSSDALAQLPSRRGVATTGAPPRKDACARSLLRYVIGDMPRNDVIAALETLTTIWRGDETEVGRRSSCSRIFTPRTTAIATPST